MSKEEVFEVKGVVLDVRPNQHFEVLIKLKDQEAKILATLSGTIRKFRIRITKGDKVTVCMSHYDLRRGRITYRDKEVNNNTNSTSLDTKPKK